MFVTGDDALLHVAALCPAVRALSLSGCKNVTDAGVRALARECHQLTSLDLTAAPGAQCVSRAHHVDGNAVASGLCGT